MPDAPKNPGARGHVLSERFADPDLVDAIFEYLLREFPQIAGMNVEQLKQQTREEFGGDKVYVRTGAARQAAADRKRVVAKVLALFNGRNASEVARQLRISRATVYRILKQPGTA